MKIIIDNIQSQAIIGGADNLLKFDLNKKIKDFLSVSIPNAHFSPAYKRGWDGKKAFITKDGKFATGFIPSILKYVAELEVPVEIEDIRPSFPVMDIANFNRSVGIEWELRPIQEEVVRKVHNYINYQGQKVDPDYAGDKLYFPRGIIDVATNGGKDSIMVGIVNNFKDTNALMLIHKSDVYAKAVKFFSKIYEVGQINTNNYKLAKFTIAMQQTLYNRAIESANVRHDLSKFGIMFVDECHAAGAKDYSRLSSMIPAPIRLFVSGTPLDTANPVNSFVTVGSSGMILAKITNKQLIDLGYSLKPTVNVLRNKCGMDERTYDEQCKKYILNGEFRVNELKDFLVREGHLNKQVLIAFDEIQHGEFMINSFIRDTRFSGINIDIVSGKDKKERIVKYDAFTAGNINILFGSTIMQEGLNIPNIQVLVFALGGKAKIPLKQFAGRGLRTDGEETDLVIVDFYDECRWLDTHSRTRLRIYKAEEFDIKYHYPADKLGRFRLK